MARVLRREFFGISRSDVCTIIPLGDIHIGANACDEEALAAVVKRIQDDDRCFFIGMGDYIDAINMRDPRFTPDSLAYWLTVAQLSDIVAAQKDRLLGYLEPIAHKCLGMLKGNHEDAVAKHYERDIYSEIVTDIRQLGKFDQDHKLQLGYYGWLRILFYSGEDRQGVTRVTMNLHHGFGGGRLAGGKALNMQRWLWSHDADIVVFGHTHNSSAQAEAVERLSDTDEVQVVMKRGCYSGSFLRSIGDNHETYSEKKGYLPLPIGGSEIILRPRAKDYTERIKILT